MNLSVDDARLFFKLFFVLLAYTNRERNAVPDVSSADDIHKAGIEGARKIRDALYKHPELLDRFIAENPERLSPEKLLIIGSWKHRVSGEFCLMRSMKRISSE